MSSATIYRSNVPPPRSIREAVVASPHRPDNGVRCVKEQCNGTKVLIAVVGEEDQLTLRQRAIATALEKLAAMMVECQSFEYEFVGRSVQFTFKS